MLALLVGRFHALTRGQAEWLAALGRDGRITRVACAVSSADHAGTRRNPLDAETREAILAPALAAAGKPYRLVRVDDIPDDSAWPAHVARAVEAATGWAVAPADTVVYSANAEVRRLFGSAGFSVDDAPARGLTPQELVQRIVDGQPWRDQAAPSTLVVYDERNVVAELRRIFGERHRTDDGELAEHRDFASYGAQMDASMAAKLDDLLPWVVPGPGRIVDKGCGTGRLLVELARRFPTASLVGVDLSRQFLRACDQLTYAAQDVELLHGDAAAQQLAPGTASTILFSSVMHEVYTYSGYDRGNIDRALACAAVELRPGGRVVIRDGVSPGHGAWRLRLLDATTRSWFLRFAAEFKHGAGASHEWLGDDAVRIDAHLANEFLCKKDYQLNWHIEVHEEYGAHTVEGWREALGRAGLAARHVRAYVNPWIAEHRYAGKVALSDDAGRPLAWPATNVVVVGEKA